MGVVYEVLDRDTQRRVALKELHTRRGDLLLRFKQEWRSVQNLQHPNLVELHELLNEDGQWYITMELVTGSNFLQYVRPGSVSPFPDSRPPAPILSDIATLPFVARPGPNNTSHSFDDADRHIAGDPIGGTLDEPKLRAALIQLFEGLAALHDVDMVHRDIKPSNCLVTSQGRVVVLDFGLITNITDDSEWEKDHLVGTALYMAPEQASLSHKVGPKADLYAVGVMLYEALTGRLPFAGHIMSVLERKQYEAAPRPDGADVELPDDLEGLCMDLIAIDPDERPSARIALARLRSASSAGSGPQPLASGSGPIAIPRIAHFVGRAHEIAEIERAFAEARQHGAVTVIIAGESGVGKSSLCSHVASRASRKNRAAVVLFGRCYQREAVPYKGVDGVIDALSRFMRALPATEAAQLLPRQASLLAQVFPVLEQVEVIAEAPRFHSSNCDAQELRSQLFGSVRELLAKLADRHPLIVAIDDLQWAGADSMAMLGEIVRPPDAPSLLLLATARTHTLPGEDSLPASLALPGDVRHIEIEGLAPGEALKLAQLLLPSNESVSDYAVAEIVAESDGHPLFIDELIRHASVLAVQPDAQPGSWQSRRSIGTGTAETATAETARAETERRGRGRRLNTSPIGGVFQLEKALWSRIQSLSGDRRVLVEVVSLAGGQLAQEVAAQAAGVSGQNIDTLVKSLRLAHLLRADHHRGKRWLEPYHDRVRSAVLEHLAPSTRRRHHRTMAELLEAEWAAREVAPRTRRLPTVESAGVEYQPLARHWREAGELDRAADYAARAAHEATRALAFDRAIGWFREAIELLEASRDLGASVRIRDLERDLGHVLANAGRCGEAARAYVAAANGAPHDHMVELKRLAMEQYLRGGHLADGFAMLRQVVNTVGLELPKSRMGAVFSLLSQRLWLKLRGLSYRPRDPGEVDPRIVTKIDITWSVSAGIAMAAPISGAGFSARNLRLSLAAGEPYRLSRALSLESMFLAASHRKLGTRANRVRELAETLARKCGNPHARGLALMARGTAHYWRGHWKDALRELDRSVAVFRNECNNVSDSPTSRLMALWALFYLGDLAELASRLPLVLRQAEERGDLQLAVNVGSGVSYLLALVRDRPGQAHTDVEAFMRRWQSTSFYFQHWNAFVALTEIELYRGDWRAALKRVEKTWPSVVRSHILRIQKIRIDGSFLKLRCGLAAAVRGPKNQRQKHLRQVRSALRAIERERMHWSDPIALVGRASLAALRGDKDRATAYLSRAEHAFDRADMALHAAVTRYHRGNLLGAGPGSELIATAETWLSERQIRNLPAFAAMLLPGLQMPSEPRQLLHTNQLHEPDPPR